MSEEHQSSTSELLRRAREANRRGVGNSQPTPVEPDPGPIRLRARPLPIQVEPAPMTDPADELTRNILGEVQTRTGAYLSDQDRKRFVERFDVALDKELFGKTLRHHLLVMGGSFALRTTARLAIEAAAGPAGTLGIVGVGAVVGGYRGYMNEKYRQQKIDTEALRGIAVSREELKQTLMSNNDRRKRMARSVFAGAVFGAAGAAAGSILADLLSPYTQGAFEWAKEHWPLQPREALPNPTAVPAPKPGLTATAVEAPKPTAVPAEAPKPAPTAISKPAEIAKPEPTAVPKPGGIPDGVRPFGPSVSAGAAGTDAFDQIGRGNIPTRDAFETLSRIHPEFAEAPARAVRENLARADIITREALVEAGVDPDKVPPEVYDKLRANTQKGMENLAELIYDTHAKGALERGLDAGGQVQDAHDYFNQSTDPNTKPSNYGWLKRNFAANKIRELIDQGQVSPEAKDLLDDKLKAIQSIDLTIAHNGSFLGNLDLPDDTLSAEGVNWVNPDNHISKEDVIKDMIFKLARANGENLTNVHEGQTIAIGKLLTDEDWQIVKAAMGTKSAEDYWQNVEPKFTEQLRKK